MPELKIPDIKLPDLREMSREDIGRAMSDVRMPDVDLSSFDPRRVDLSKVERPKIDLSKIDVGKAVDTVAVAAHLRKRSRSPIRFVVGGIAVVGLAVFAVLNIPALRARLESVTRSIRERVEAQRGYLYASDTPDATDSGSQAFPSAVAAPVQPDPYAASLPSATHGLDATPDELTEGIGARTEDQGPNTI
jgi:hypothetical protein